MNNLKETHPSLCKISNLDKNDYEYLIDSEHRDGGWIATRVGDYHPSAVTIEGVVEHTIDKAVLRELLSRRRETPFRGTEASDDLNSQVIEDIWGLLEGKE